MRAKARQSSRREWNFGDTWWSPCRPAKLSVAEQSGQKLRGNGLLKIWGSSKRTTHSKKECRAFEQKGRPWPRANAVVKGTEGERKDKERTQEGRARRVAYIPNEGGINRQESTSENAAAWAATVRPGNRRCSARYLAGRPGRELGREAPMVAL